MPSIAKRPFPNSIGRLTAAVLMASALTGCQTPPTEAEGSFPALGPPTITPHETSEMSLDALTDAASVDLAERLNVDLADITVESAERVIWRDGSIGCPQPEGFYTQALVNGYRIMLKAEGQVHAYHGRDGGQPFHCPHDRRQMPLPARGERSSPNAAR